MHLFYPPKCCIRIFFQFLLGITVLQFMHFGGGGGGGGGVGRTKYVMGNAKVGELPAFLFAFVRLPHK